MQDGVSEDGLIFAKVQDDEVEFRDGRRIVPSHLVPFFARLETHRMTYKEAVAAANKMMEGDFINAQSDAFVSAHFKGPR